MSSLSTHSTAAAALMKSLQFIDNEVMSKLVKKAAISHLNIVRFIKKQRQQDDNVDMISPPPSPPPLPPPPPPTSVSPSGPKTFLKPKKRRNFVPRYQSTPNGAATTTNQTTVKKSLKGPETEKEKEYLKIKDRNRERKPSGPSQEMSLTSLKTPKIRGQKRKTSLPEYTKERRSSIWRRYDGNRNRKQI